VATAVRYLSTLLAALALLHSTPSAGQLAPTDLGKRVQACTQCHGKEGRATPDGFFPRIAGKPQGYLLAQLVAFRDAKRQHNAMTLLLANLSDTYLNDIARHFSQLDLPYATSAIVPSMSTEQAARGASLALKGDAALKIPACVQCHGQRLTGIAPNLPGLLGLPRDYLVAQLGAWQNANRTARAPDCMAQIAKKLSAQDVAAVTSWLASVPMPAVTKPQAQLQEPLPMECGSIQ
jgi:cytochrome c553